MIFSIPILHDVSVVSDAWGVVGGSNHLLRNITHSKIQDPILLKKLQLPEVLIANTDINDFLSVNFMPTFNPAKRLFRPPLCHARSEGNNHVAYDSGGTTFRGINARMSINTDERCITSIALLDSLGNTRERAKGNHAVTSQGEDRPPQTSIVVDSAAHILSVAACWIWENHSPVTICLRVVIGQCAEMVDSLGVDIIGEPLQFFQKPEFDQRCRDDFVWWLQLCRVSVIYLPGWTRGIGLLGHG